MAQFPDPLLEGKTGHFQQCGWRKDDFTPSPVGTAQTSWYKDVLFAHEQGNVQGSIKMLKNKKKKPYVNC